MAFVTYTEPLEADADPANPDVEVGFFAVPWSSQAPTGRIAGP